MAKKKAVAKKTDKKTVLKPEPKKAAKPEGKKAAKTTREQAAKAPVKVAPKALSKKSAPVAESGTESKASKVEKKKVVTFSKEDLNHFRQLLLSRRETLNGNLQTLDGSVETKPGISSADEMGSDSFDSDMVLGLMEKESREIQKINDALSRIQDKSYGICEGCEEPIERKRLEVLPFAQYCLPCKSKMEESEHLHTFGSSAPQQTSEEAEYQE